MHRRVDAASRFVVFQNLLGPPPRTYRLKKAEAFALIMERCGYEAVWRSDSERITLQFRQASGAFALERFESPSRFGIASDKDLMMSKVFEAGLEGWFALPSDMFTILHSIEEQKLRGSAKTRR